MDKKNRTVTCSGRKMGGRENGEIFRYRKKHWVKQTLRGGRKIILKQSKFHTEILKTRGGK